MIETCYNLPEVSGLISCGMAFTSASYPGILPVYEDTLPRSLLLASWWADQASYLNPLEGFIRPKTKHHFPHQIQTFQYCGDMALSFEADYYYYRSCIELFD